MNNIKLINDDCMNVMKNYENNYFDLAIVDPPYGIKRNKMNMGNSIFNSDKKKWDNSIPTKYYFKELFRVSKNQIIWGGNYMTKYLKPSSCWLLWDKGFSENLTFAQFEMAWTSFNSSAKKYDKHPNQLNRIHPTQKPIKLYEWILKKYSKKEHKILDTHLGSGSSAIASYYFGVKEFVGIELDKEYFETMEKRFKQQTKQIKLF